MLPEFSQLGTENRAEKVFTASHISLKKVSLAPSELFRDFCSEEPEMYARHVQTVIFNPKSFHLM